MLSIVVPVFNEQESLNAFYKEVIKFIPVLSKSYEIVFVDDGSTDGSLDVLKDLTKKNKSVRIYSFRRNQGKAEALKLGFIKAKGDYIITLDADLQDVPSEIPKLLAEAKNGCELVCGWRRNRKDALLKIISSKFFNFVAKIIWGLKLHDYNSGLKVYKAQAAKSLNLYGGLYRFIPLLAYQEGFSVCEVPIVHAPRKFGKSKYRFSKIWNDLPDMFTMLFLSRYSKRPLHFFGLVGSVLGFIGVIILIYLSVIHFQGYAIGRRPLLFLGMLLVLSGFQVFFTGFLADLIISLSSKKDKEFILKYSTE
ncbi:MAG: glycosyltransferase family 2 protein [Patescibacteria group bacterium]|nr:glycosyltransferase family 2 protein [Patescibacteria group bacterium]